MCVWMMRTRKLYVRLFVCASVKPSVAVIAKPNFLSFSLPRSALNPQQQLSPATVASSEPFHQHHTTHAFLHATSPTPRYPRLGVHVRILTPLYTSRYSRTRYTHTSLTHFFMTSLSVVTPQFIKSSHTLSSTLLSHRYHKLIEI